MVIAHLLPLILQSRNCFRDEPLNCFRDESLNCVRDKSLNCVRDESLDCVESLNCLCNAGPPGNDERAPALEALAAQPAHLARARGQPYATHKQALVKMRTSCIRWLGHSNLIRLPD